MLLLYLIPSDIESETVFNEVFLSFGEDVLPVLSLIKPAFRDELLEVVVLLAGKGDVEDVFLFEVSCEDTGGGLAG